MAGFPPLKLHHSLDAKPVAVSKAYPILVHWGTSCQQIWRNVLKWVPAGILWICSPRTVLLVCTPTCPSLPSYRCRRFFQTTGEPARMCGDGNNLVPLDEKSGNVTKFLKLFMRFRYKTNPTEKVLWGCLQGQVGPHPRELWEVGLPC